MIKLVQVKAGPLERASGRRSSAQLVRTTLCVKLMGSIRSDVNRWCHK